MLLKVLVVDDSAVMRKLIIKALNETEYKPTQVVEAGDGVDALKKFDETPGINLILSDWNMPNMDGLTFVKNVRAKPTGKNTAVLMITTEGTMEKMEAALNEGVDNYLTKPFNGEKLNGKLKTVLGKIS